ncbi:MAG: DUF1028 domain-containing protein [Alphaproteobacteria bacterium]
MTYTVVARCPDTRALGICLATSPFGVASRCPHVRSNVAAISSQSHSNWRLALMGLDMVENGLTGAEILKTLAAYDAHFAYRQVGIVPLTGPVAVHTGAKCGPWAGHKHGEDFITMGNGLVGPGVVEAMHDAFLDNAGQDFEERLLRTIEAGFGAGGEPIGQRSAGLIVADANAARPRTDLRIDKVAVPPEEGGDAVKELRALFDSFKPLIPYYADFWLDHPEVGWKQWLAERTA